jgi:hypothetical protein
MSVWRNPGPCVYLSLAPSASHVESVYYVLSVKRDEGLTCTGRLVDQARRTRLVVVVSGRSHALSVCVPGPYHSPSGLCGTTRARSHQKIGTRRAILSRTSGKSYREETSNPCTLVSVRTIPPRFKCTYSTYFNTPAYLPQNPLEYRFFGRI